MRIRPRRHIPGNKESMLGDALISPDRSKDWPATTSAFEAFVERHQPDFSKVAGSTNRLA
jgi:hypothetical protein